MTDPWLIGVLIVVAMLLLVGWSLRSRSQRARIDAIRSAVSALGRGVEVPRLDGLGGDEVALLAVEVNELADRLGAEQRVGTARNRRIRTILDAILESVLVTDTRGRIEFGNEALRQLVGRNPEGHTPIEVIRHPSFRELLRRAETGYPAEAEFELALRPGSGPRQVRGTAAPLHGEGGIVVVLQDITVQRNAERARRDFVANASHELRTPLTAIRGFAETIKTGDADADTTRRYLEIISRHAIRLDSLVSDMLELSRAEAADADDPGWKGVSLPAIVESIVTGFESKLLDKNLHLEVRAPSTLPKAYGGSREFERIVTNLIDNAVKYAPAEAQIVVELSAVQGDGDEPRVQLEVANTGRGIPARHLPRLFERFYRVDEGRSRELGGTGLGLAIVKHLVQQMGGAIEVESEPDGWTRFRASFRQAS